VTVAVSDPFCHGAFAVLEEMTGLSLRMVICPGGRSGRSLPASTRPVRPRAVRPREGRFPGRKRKSGSPRGGGSGFAADPAPCGVPRNVGRPDVPRRPGRCDRGTLRVDTCAPALLPPPVPKTALRRVPGTCGRLGRARPSLETVFHSSPRPESSLSRRVSCAVSPARGDREDSPGLAVGISLDSVGLNPGQLDITGKILRKGTGSSSCRPRPEGIATTLFAMLREEYRPGFAPSPSRSATASGTRGISSWTGVRRRSGIPATGPAGGVPRSDILMIEHLPDPAALAPAAPRAGRPLVLCGIRGSTSTGRFARC